VEQWEEDLPVNIMIRRQVILMVDNHMDKEVHPSQCSRLLPMIHMELNHMDKEGHPIQCSNQAGMDMEVHHNQCNNQVGTVHLSQCSNQVVTEIQRLSSTTSSNSLKCFSNHNLVSLISFKELRNKFLQVTISINLKI